MVTTAPLAYRSVSIVDPITGNQATVVAGALTVSSSGGGGGDVNLVQVGGAAIALGQVASASSLPVTIASDQSLAITGTVTASGTVSLGAGAATIGALTANQSVNISQMNGVTTTMGNGVSGTGVQRVTLASDSTGQVALASGSQIQLIPGTSGGLSLSRTIIPNNTTNIIIKGSAGQLYGLWASNNSTTIAYVKIYNAASATAGSGTPVDTVMIPAPAAGGGGGLVWSMPNGVAFGTGITIIITTGIADNDTAAPAASTYIVTAYYK